MRSGLPVKHFVAACNSNDVVPHYLQTKVFTPKKAIHTLSNAMDVGDPSNFVRILEIVGQDFSLLSQKLSAYSIDDSETMDAIRKVYKDYQYILDPHAAVGYAALEKHLHDNAGSKGIVLSTAHPVKFPEAVETAIGKTVDIPPSLQPLLKKQKQALKMKADYAIFKEYLMQ